MIMDLDHFKEINDTLGHYHGDRLLMLVGERLTAVLRAEDTVARMGGDEFAVLLPSVPDRAYAMSVADKILGALRAPFEIDGLSLEVGASIGIASFPVHGEDKETLIQRADIAMYVAKADHSGAQLYETEQDRHSVQRLALAGELRRAIENGELVLHYQPKIDVATGRLIGAEALARWQHPSIGLIMPDEFVPLAEHTGLITPMTRQVISLALEQVAHWRAQGYRLSVAVNLCARSFLDQQLLEDVPELLEKYGVDASLLELEITESMIVGDPDRARGVLEQLHKLGITLAIDDFGTGYSSLAYLRELPVDEIKIDKSFVLEMGSDGSADETIVRSIIDLAHNLQLRAVAEGVEDPRILGRLLELGCDVAQGYHISRPLPPTQFENWMDAHVAPRLTVAAVPAAAA
jgi:diguanylate cyclase (GGDEF)-like protein